MSAQRWRDHRRFRRAVAAATATAALAGAAAAHGVALHRIGSFDKPIDIVAAPGVRGTAYVVERPGRVVAVRGRQRHTFLDIASRTTTDGERGLLSIAFSPRFQR